VVILGLGLFSSLSVPVAAAATPSIKLVLGGTGATPWAIGPIAPGDNGTKSVTLSNTGFNSGVVTIWISDIVNSEGANPQSETGDMAEPGELGDYILLNVSGANLSTDFILPAKISDFPQSDNDTKHIYLNPLNAFSTLNLQWEWRLPLETGDDVQGDNLSFTINYMLEEVPPLPLPPPSPPPSSGGGEAPQANTSVGIMMTDPSDMVVGTTGSYTITATNTGETALNDVVVTGYLSEFLNFLSSVPPGTVIGNQITWSLGFLNIGETKEITVILGGVKTGTAVVTVVMTTREGITSTFSLNVTVLDAPGVPAPASTPVPAPSLPPAPVLPQAAPDNKSPFTTETLPLVIPAPSGTPEDMSVWLIPAILAVIGAAALVYYIVIIMTRRRLRWDWKLNVLTAGAVNVIAQTAEQRTLYAAKHQKRVAELASAIAREMNLSKKLGGTDMLLKARILAVAGVVETMAYTVKRTSLPRRHRPAIDLDKILEEIKRNGGALYDSEAVKAFVRLFERGKFGFQTNYD